MADETADAPQRWTAKRRVALVVSPQGGDVGAGRGPEARADGGGDRGVARAVSARGRECPAGPAQDEEALKNEHIKKLKQKIGELVLDLDILKEATKDCPFPPRTSDE